ncbi:ANL family adenylate-forming protein [Marinomonas sp. BSi20584]|uniref:ANL family adenylate-forming protein n=1 Tax=Marinomonas sp. BSi20584 TaxID=1594462 RepID=UPI000CC58632|nr:fatty acid--CoA ligase family protein [Marinomonas sp. BSi20584]PJE53317.1 O-succinylbenzoate--CoA ligase [Marinomonas sp. BSi20584]
MSWIIDQFSSLRDKTAIVDVFGAFTYKDLHDQIQSYKFYLDKELKDGQIVAVLSDYNFYAVALLFALHQKKAVIVPIVTNNQDEVAKKLDVIQPNWIIKLNDNRLSLSKVQNNKTHSMLTDLIVSHQSGLVLFSSGSTGEPKAMVHNLDNLVNSYLGKKLKKLNVLIFLMFDHIGGLNTLLSTLAMGAKIILPANRNPDHIAKLIEEQSIHVLPASPTFLNLLLMAKVQEKYDLKSLKMITYGTEAMPESLLQKLKATFPKTKLLQTFGTSETGITQTTSRSSNSLEMKLDDPNTEYKIVDNELWLRSKTQVVGYLNASMESFTDDGWFKTGDLVEELPDGYIRIKGRAKEVINVGGEKVLPAEVESIVLEVDGVADCTAYAAKNAITGQMVAVQIVLKEGAEPKEVKNLIRKYCRQKLEAYKVPAKFEFVEETNFGERFKKKRL